jgi:hypothetical protein
LNTILQIVPRVPGGLDGVGDYALNLAAKLRDRFGCITAFATPNPSSATSIRGFEVLPLDIVQHQPGRFEHILLHYVNYGYQKRGVPFGLLSILRHMRRPDRRKLLTIFHELYASGPVLSSSFWLQPLQIHLTKSVARLSDECIVSSDSFLGQLRRLVPCARINVHPTASGLEEPQLSREQIASRDVHRWVIVGGTGLAERCLRSLSNAIREIPDSIGPRRLLVLGGEDNPVVRALLADLPIQSDYHPRIAAPEASQILRTCSFAWFNYFHRTNVETSVVLKSSAFAAVCAHAVIPVFPHRGRLISLEGDQLPGPFFVSRCENDVPNPGSRAATAQAVYDWYQRHASSEILANRVAELLGLSGAR